MTYGSGASTVVIYHGEIRPIEFSIDENAGYVAFDPNDPLRAVILIPGRFGKVRVRIVNSLQMVIERVLA